MVWNLAGVTDPPDAYFDLVLGVFNYQFDGLGFSTDGTKAIFCGRTNTNLNIQRYDLSVPWDISTAVASGDAWNYGAASSTAARGVFMDPAGYHFVTCYSTAVASIPLLTAWSPVTHGATDNNTGLGSLHGVAMSPDGTYMWLSKASWPYYVQRYTLSTAWHVSTATVDGGVYCDPSTDFPGGYLPYDIAASADGHHLWVLVGQATYPSTTYIAHYYCETAWGAGTLVDYTDVPTGYSAVMGLGMDSPHGSRLYICDVESYDASVYQWNLGGAGGWNFLPIGG